MTLTDVVQIIMVLLLIALLLRPLYGRWLPAQWRSLTRRLLPPRSLKYEGTWQRSSSKTDKEK